MRYQKGSIGLNDRKDKAILTLVADSRYVTGGAPRLVESE
jgi:hypothetical protein